jgi:hypothetical protein
MHSPQQPSSTSLARRTAAFLDDEERKLLTTLAAATLGTLLLALTVFSWSGWLMFAISAVLTVVVWVALLAVVYLGLSVLRRVLVAGVVRADSRRDEDLAARTGRYLGVTLSATRQAVLEQVTGAVAGIDQKVRLLPNEGVRSLAELMVAQQRDLLPEVEHSLRLAQYLEDQSRELARRTADPAVTAKLERVQARVAEMDVEARRVADLATDCEASLLATLSERDERLLTDLFTEYSARFETHYQIVREVNDQLRDSGTGTAAWDVAAAATATQAGAPPPRRDQANRMSGSAS